jgi:hypothetical protein
VKATARGLVAATVFLAACKSQEVVIRGQAENGRARPDVFWPLPNGTVTIFDQDALQYASARTDARGTFRTVGPAAQTVFATVTGEGLATSSFTGVTGPVNGGPLIISLDEDQDSPLYGVLLTDVDELREEFAGCPGADVANGIVFGEVRVIGITDPVTDEEPTVATAEVKVGGANEQELMACYLDDAGRIYDPEATVTGDSGRFAIFGVPSGLWTMSVTYSAFVESDVETFSTLYVPEGDVAVVPREPTWVEFPF